MHVRRDDQLALRATLLTIRKTLLRKQDEDRGNHLWFPRKNLVFKCLVERAENLFVQFCIDFWFLLDGLEHEFLTSSIDKVLSPINDIVH